MSTDGIKFATSGDNFAEEAAAFEEPKKEAPKEAPKADPKPEPKAEPKADPKPEPKAEPKADPKPEPKTEQPEEPVLPTRDPLADPDAPKEEPKAEAEEPKDKYDPEVWGDPGDPVARAALKTMANSDVTPDEARDLLWDAMEKSDPSLIDEAKLVEKLGEDSAALVMSSVRDVTTRHKAAVEAVNVQIEAAVGSQENWKAAAAWARDNLPENELNDLRGMINAGGSKSKFAIGEIVSKYNADPKNSTLDPKQEKGDSAAADPKVEPMTGLEYGQALRKLVRTRKATPEAKAALWARRQAGMPK